MTFLRRGLQCFYCGRRSAQHYRPGLARWQCEACEAVNYLDQNGDITDPPHDQTNQGNNSFAVRTSRAASPNNVTTDSLFCQVCLNNQQIVTKTLAEYLPPSDDPHYAEYVAGYEDYKRGLESRYPQVCETCEPKVRARIRETGYTAKTDHFRRRTEKSRYPSANQNSGLLYIVRTLATISWWAALLGHLFWHAVGVLAVGDVGLRDEDTSLLQCIVQGAVNHSMDQACYQHTNRVKSVSMLLALASIWVVPSSQQPSVRRIRGVGEYYRLQLVLNVLRLGAIVYLGRDSPRFEASTARPTHVLMFMINLIIPILAYRSLQVDELQISFHDRTEPLIDRKSKTQSPLPSVNLPNTMAANVQPFPINNLSMERGRSTTPTGRITPPPEPSESEWDTTTVADSVEDFANDSDAMDIDTPVRDPFAFQPRVRNSTPQRTDPSPFHGKLPAAPVGPAHKLRNPPNKPTFQQASSIAKQNYFSDIHGSKATHQKEVASTSDNSANRMAEQRFFASDESSTGLEDIFKGIFSLNEEPFELRRQQKIAQDEQSEEQTLHTLAQSENLLSAVGMALTLIAWNFGSSFGIPSASRLGALLVAGCISSRRLVDSLSPSRTYWKLSDVLIFTLELGFGLVLLWAELEVPTSQVETMVIARQSAPWYLSCITVQEIVLYAYELWAVWQELRSAHARNLDNPALEPTSVITEQHAQVSSPAPDIPRTSTDTSPPLQRFLQTTPMRSTRSTTRNLAGDVGRDHTPNNFATTSGFGGLGLGGSPTPPRRPSANTWQGRSVRRQLKPWEQGTI